VSIIAAAWESLWLAMAAYTWLRPLISFALDDPCTNLRALFPLPGLLERVEVFVNARSASGTVLAGEAVQETFVPLAAVAGGNSRAAGKELS